MEVTLKGARVSPCLQATSRVGRKGFPEVQDTHDKSCPTPGQLFYCLTHRFTRECWLTCYAVLSRLWLRLRESWFSLLSFFVERLPQRISINTRGLIHRLHDWGQTVWRGGNRSSSAVWTGACQAILLGHYFLICKKKGPDSAMAKVPSSSVNSMFLKNTWILKEEHLLGFPDKRAQGVFVLDLLPHPDFLL